jgi:hypothetical protein
MSSLSAHIPKAGWSSTFCGAFFLAVVFRLRPCFLTMALTLASCAI